MFLKQDPHAPMSRTRKNARRVVSEPRFAPAQDKDDEFKSIREYRIRNVASKRIPSRSINSF